jgi:hypothetical protein
VTSKSSRAKLNSSSLRKFNGSGGGCVIISVLFHSIVGEFDLGIEDPHIGGSSIEKTSDLLRRVAHIHFRNVGVVFEVDLSNVSDDWDSIVVNRTVRNIIDLCH